YSEGVDVGYRWFDRQGTAPLFAFGHGLSYTHFKYSNLSAARAADGGLDLSFTLANSGKLDGDEVAEVYLGAPQNPPANAQFPVRALAGFTRVHLKAGESRSVALHVAPRQLQYWSADGWKAAPGPRTVFIGASSRDLRLNKTLPSP
ncbi:MAG TPA: fibronectin type III-like domain-contianing protein, partial [Rhizomicrobium sp.]